MINLSIFIVASLSIYQHYVYTELTCPAVSCRCEKYTVFMSVWTATSVKAMWNYFASVLDAILILVLIRSLIVSLTYIS